MRKIWKNRLEFYPYLAIFNVWFLGCYLASLGVQGKPGITKLGWITLPAVIAFIISVVRTYKGLKQGDRGA